MSPRIGPGTQRLPLLENVCMKYGETLWIYKKKALDYNNSAMAGNLNYKFFSTLRGHEFLYYKLGILHLLICVQDTLQHIYYLFFLDFGDLSQKLPHLSSVRVDSQIKFAIFSYFWPLISNNPENAFSNKVVCYHKPGLLSVKDGQKPSK